MVWVSPSYSCFWPGCYSEDRKRKVANYSVGVGCAWGCASPEDSREMKGPCAHLQVALIALWYQSRSPGVIQLVRNKTQHSMQNKRILPSQTKQKKMTFLRIFKVWCRNAKDLMCVHICQRWEFGRSLVGLYVLVTSESHAMLCIFRVMQGTEVAFSHHAST